MRDYEGVKPSWMDIKKMYTRLLPDFTKEVPFQIKGIATKDAHNAYWATMKANKNKQKNFRFRSKKQPVQSVFIPKSAIKEKGIYPTILGGNKYKEILPENICDSRLTVENGVYLLHVSYKTQITTSYENQGRIVALDPGVRTFLTFFSENSCGHIGHNDFGRIARMCHHLDDLISRSTKVCARQRKRMRIVAARMRMKIRNLVKELHWKTADYLTKNFDVILLPKFETSQMITKGKRKLRAKSVRAMLTWSHYLFKMRLRHKAFERGKVVIDVTEEYTSKTVSWTGELKENLGGSREIKSGGIVLDRDLNGARNIFIKSLVDTPILLTYGR